MPPRRLVFSALIVGTVAGGVLTLALVDRVLGWSLAPEWVQAGAAVLSFITTIVLAYLTWRYVQVTREIATATRQQVEGVLAESRSRQRVVAATLLEDVHRIQGELGPRAVTGGVPDLHTDAVVPRVHHWLEPLIPQIAETDPAVVGLFLRLDRDLHNYAAGCTLVKQVQVDLSAKQETLATYTRTYRGEAATMDEVTPWAEAERDVRLANDKVQQALDATTTAFDRCHATLDEIARALNRVLGPSDMTLDHQPQEHSNMADTPGEGHVTAPRDPDYEKWLQIQYEMAHHDIWWVKGQQMKAGNWTLLLLAALVSVGYLLTPSGTGSVLGPRIKYLLALFGLLVTLLGALYVWDLRATLVASRARAKRIVAPIQDPERILVDATRDPERHPFFPWAVTLIQYVGLGFVAAHFAVPVVYAAAVPLALLLATPKLGDMLRGSDED